MSLRAGADRGSRARRKRFGMWILGRNPCLRANRNAPSEDLNLIAGVELLDYEPSRILASKSCKVQRTRPEAPQKPSSHVRQVLGELQSSWKEIAERVCSQEAGIDLSLAVFAVVSGSFPFFFPLLPVDSVLQTARFQATRHLSAVSWRCSNRRTRSMPSTPP